MYIVHLWVCVCIDQLRGCPSTRKLPKLISSSQYDNSPHYLLLCRGGKERKMCACTRCTHCMYMYVCMHEDMKVGGTRP